MDAAHPDRETAILFRRKPVLFHRYDVQDGMLLVPGTGRLACLPWVSVA